MALIKCPECGRDISDKAKACIHCGYPIPGVKHQAALKESKQVQVAPVVEGPVLVEVQPVKPSMSKKQKTIICLLVLIAAFAFILILSAKSS